jgi:hypothetical protein
MSTAIPVNERTTNGRSNAQNHYAKFLGSLGVTEGDVTVDNYISYDEKFLDYLFNLKLPGSKDGQNLYYSVGTALQIHSQLNANFYDKTKNRGEWCVNIWPEYLTENKKGWYLKHRYKLRDAMCNRCITLGEAIVEKSCPINREVCVSKHDEVS